LELVLISLVFLQVMTGDSCSGQIYIVNVDTVNSGIPYAESFYVTSNFCLSRVSDNESNLCVVSAIKYKKAVWGLVKSKQSFCHSLATQSPFPQKLSIIFVA
jgi:hypothetical protein